MRLLICGDRNWADQAMIENELKKLAQLPKVVIEGEARGADRLARFAADALGIAVLRFPAEWNKYGRAAGPLRNQQMLDEGKPDEVWAFHDDITNSKGTRDMVRRANHAGVVVRILSHS